MRKLILGFVLFLGGVGIACGDEVIVAEPKQALTAALVASSPDEAFGGGLIDWWDSRLGQTTNAGKISAWVGQKNGTTLTSSAATNPPNYAADASFFRGLPVVQTAIADNSFLGAVLANPLVSAGGRPYMAIVHRLRTLHASTPPDDRRVLELSSGDGVSQLALLLGTNGTGNDFQGSTFVPDWPASGVHYIYGDDDQTTSRVVISEAWVDSAGFHFARDGMEHAFDATAKQPLVHAFRTITVGSDTSYTQPSDSSIAAIVVSATPPTDAQRAAFGAYANGQWDTAFCGDGVVQAGEECDASRTDNDVCSKDCKLLASSASPEDIFGSTLTEWWDARLGQTVVAGKITAWAGQKAGTVLSPANASNAPVYSNDGAFFRGQPVVQSAIADNSFLGGSAEPFMPSGSQPYVALVHRLRTLHSAAVPDDRRVFEMSSGDGVMQFALVLDNDNMGSDNVRASYVPSWPSSGIFSAYGIDAQTTGSVVLSEFWVDGGGLHYALNGVQRAVVPEANAALPHALRLITIGSDSSYTQPSDSSFAQVVVASVPPTSAQRKLFAARMRGAWGTTFCGDGITEGNEQCDDGNVIDSDGCRNDCTINAGTSSAIAADGTLQFKPSTIRLTASRDSVSGAQTDASASDGAGVAFEIPARLRVTVGNAGNGEAVLQFTDDAGSSVTCNYRGGSGIASPTRELDRAAGQYYRFVSCTNGAQAEDHVIGRTFTLKVLSGDPQSPRTQVELNPGPGCSGVLDPLILPEDVVRMRQEFDWEATHELPTTDSQGLPALRYALVYVESMEQVDALRQSGMYFRSKPLFAQDLQHYAGKCGLIGGLGDNRGQFLYALMPATIYNYYRERALLSISQLAGPVPFRAIVLPPIPEPAVTNPDGTVSWSALWAAGFDYFDGNDELQAPFLGPLDEIIDGIIEGNVAKVIGGIFAPGIPTLVDVANGRKEVTQLFIPSDFTDDIERTRALLQVAHDRLISIIGGLDLAVNGTIDVNLVFDVMNSDPMFSAGSTPANQYPMTRAWGWTVPMSADQLRLGPHDAHAEITQFGIGDIAITRSKRIDSDGRVHMKVAKRDGARGTLCIQLENSAARFASGFDTDTLCDFGNLDPVFDGFHHNIPDPASDPYGRSEIRLQITDKRMNAFVQITDGYEYMDKVVHHRPRQALVGSGDAANIIGVTNGNRPFTPCLSFPEMKAASQPILLLLSGLMPIATALPGSDGLFGIPSLQRDMLLMLNDEDTKVSRGIVSHEYGHFVMCDAFHEADPVSLLAMYNAWLFDDETGRNDHVRVSMESFADFFASQISGGTNYAVPQLSSASANMSYCITGATPPCLDRNYRGIMDSNAGDEYHDEITRRVSTFYDAFDHPVDWRTRGFVPTNADQWSVGLPPVTIATTPSGQDTDDQVELPGPAIFQWLQSAANRTCVLSGCTDTLDLVSMLQGLYDAMKANGVSWCRACEMLALHDRTFSAAGKPLGDIWRACTSGELAEILGPPPVADLRMNAGCMPCGAGLVSDGMGACVSCPTNRDIVDANGMCSTCVPGTIAVGNVCQNCGAREISVGNVCVACGEGLAPQRITNTCADCPADATVDWSTTNLDCPGVSVPVTASQPGDLCPETFVVQVSGLSRMGPSGATPANVRVSGRGIVATGGTSCTSNNLAYRGRSQFIAPSGPIAKNSVSADTTARECTSGPSICRGTCVFDETLLDFLPSINLDNDGYKLYLAADPLAGHDVDIMFGGDQCTIMQ